MIFGEGRLKDLWRRGVWGPGVALAAAAPAPLEALAVRGVGRVAGRGLTKKRAILRANLHRAFPDRTEAELDSVAADAFAAHFANQYASFSFAKCARHNWTRYLEFRGLHRLEAAAARGRGVVLMHPHMGPAQLPLHVLGLLGFDMHQVGGGRVTLVDLSVTGQWAAGRRAALEAQMPVSLHDGRGYLRPVLRALQGGAVVMSACDATGGGEELGRRHPRKVLGLDYPVPIGPIWMAWRSGAPLLTVHCWRERGASAPYVAQIGEELEVARELALRPALERGADTIAAFLDRVLRAHPGDWLFWDGFAPGGLL